MLGYFEFSKRAKKEGEEEEEHSDSEEELMKISGEGRSQHPPWAGVGART